MGILDFFRSSRRKDPDLKKCETCPRTMVIVENAGEDRIRLTVDEVKQGVGAAELCWHCGRIYCDHCYTKRPRNSCACGQRRGKLTIRGNVSHEGPVHLVKVRYAGVARQDAPIRVEENPSVLLCVCYSPDGRWVVTGDEDNAVRVWDVRTRRSVHSLYGHDDAVWSVSVSPDGGRIASGSYDGTVRIWDARDGRQTAVLDARSGPVWAVRFSPAGDTLFSGSADARVRVWNAASGRTVRVLEGHRDVVRGVAPARGSGEAVSGSLDGRVLLWNLDTGALVAELEGHTDGVLSVAVSEDGRYIVSGAMDHTIQVWDRVRRAPVTYLDGHEGWVQSVGFSPDGTRLVSGSVDGTVRVWDLARREQVKMYDDRRHLGPNQRIVYGVAYAPNEPQVASAAADSSLLFYDL